MKNDILEKLIHELKKINQGKKVQESNRRKSKRNTNRNKKVMIEKCKKKQKWNERIT